MFQKIKAHKESFLHKISGTLKRIKTETIEKQKAEPQYMFDENILFENSNLIIGGQATN